MAEKWLYSSNQFEISTRGSNVRMLSFSTDTDAKLSNEVSDPDILAIYNNYHPLHVAYQLICSNYDAKFGARRGQTLDLETMITDTLDVELRKWEAGVGVVYVEGSPQWVAIFPQHRKPFISGYYEDRINAVHTLYEVLNGNPLLAALGAQVQSFYNVLHSARLSQQQKEDSVNQFSDNREQQRIITAQGLYGFVLGDLMKKYRNDPQQIERFFDLSLIQKHAEHVAPNEAIVKGKVTIEGTATPVGYVSVQLFANGSLVETVTATKKGNYKFKFDNVQPGLASVMLKVDAPGFDPFVEAFDGQTGTIYVKNLALTPAQSMLKVA